jgi:hypothetical protein
VPQMVGLDRIDGVSFTKGCYPGQEIVARTRYLGTVKRHLYHLVLAGPAAPGTPILAGDQQVGTVLRAVEAPGQAVEALAVIDGAAAQSDNLSTAAGMTSNLRRVHPDASPLRVHVYVYYRIAASDHAAAADAVRRLLVAVAKGTGVTGRCMRRQDDPETWMEVYEAVGDAAAFCDHAGGDRRMAKDSLP